MAAGTSRLSFAGGTLVMQGMQPNAVKQFFPAPTWVWDGRVSAWRCEALHYLAVRRALRGSGLAYVDVVPQWRRTILVFAGSNAMARDVSRRFLIPCLLNHCAKKERFDILEGLRDGIYPALVANQVLDEGVDVPEAKVAIVIGGTASTRQAPAASRPHPAQDGQRAGHAVRSGLCGHKGRDAVTPPKG
jgi:hypothetical protein